MVTDEDLMPEPARRARVDGTQTDRTEVWIEDDAVAVSCDCPNAADGWFCKHQVALALVWRDRQETDAAPAAPSPPAQAPAYRAAGQGTKRACTAVEQCQALQDFLHSQEPAVLVGKRLELADRDASITGALQQWHKAGTVGQDLVGLKRLIGTMLAPGRPFIAWNQSATDVAQASAALPLLQRAGAQRATAAVALCLHALHCVWAVLQHADDSDGEIRVCIRWQGICRLTMPTRRARYGCVFWPASCSTPAALTAMHWPW